MFYLKKEDGMSIYCNNVCFEVVCVMLDITDSDLINLPNVKCPYFFFFY